MVDEIARPNSAFEGDLCANLSKHPSVHLAGVTLMENISGSISEIFSIASRTAEMTPFHMPEGDASGSIHLGIGC